MDKDTIIDKLATYIRDEIYELSDSDYIEVLLGIASRLQIEAEKRKEAINQDDD